MQSLNTSDGMYRPAFFRIYLDVDTSLTATIPSDWDKETQSVFFHEYIHFLQDISTFAGLNNIYCISEYVKLVATKYANQNPFELPVVLEDNTCLVRLNNTINDQTAGDSWPYAQLSLYGTFTEEYTDDDLKNAGINSLSNILLLNTERDYKFGRREIMESMAYILQKECSDWSVPPLDYPYSAAEKVTRLLLSDEFADDCYNIIALCDISLMTSNPCYSFTCFLDMIKTGKWKVQKAEDIYDNFYKSQSKGCFGIGSPISHYRKFVEVVRKSLKDYIDQEQISAHLNQWIDLVIDEGLNIRLNEKYFFIELARSKEILGYEKFVSLFKHIGSPLIENKNHEFCRFPSSPDYGDNVQYLMAIETLLYIFKYGKTQCKLKDFCRNSLKNNSNLIINEQCDTSPWNKFGESPECCPVSFLFHHRKLAINPPTLRL